MKKVNLYKWRSENNHQEVGIIRRYHLQDRNDYEKYNRISGQVTKVVAKLKTMSDNNTYRIMKTEQLLNKLYDMGVISSKKSLIVVEKLAVAAFCRRRLAVVIKQLKMAETMADAVSMIEQGHILVGIDTVTDPSFHVDRSMEDHITWVKDSKIRAKVMKYNNTYN